MTPQETARELLDFYGGDASRWTQGAHARTALGAKLFFDDADSDGLGGWDHRRSATCFCLAGAACMIDGAPVLASGPDGFAQLSDRVLDLTGFVATTWNDSASTTFADVVALLEKIAAEPERAP